MRLRNIGASIALGLLLLPAWAGGPSERDQLKGFITAVKEAQSQASSADVERQVWLRSLLDAAAWREKHDAACKQGSYCAIEALKKMLSDGPPKSGSGEPISTVRITLETAQAAVDKLRGRSGEVAYERGDAGIVAAAALAPYAQLGGGAERASVPARVAEWHQLAIDGPRLLRQHIAHAQTEVINMARANACYLAGATKSDDCTQTPGILGMVAKVAFDIAIDQGEKVDRKLSDARVALETLKDKPLSELKAISEAADFRFLLDTNADVKSFFGSDAAGFSAGTADNTISFRLIRDLDGSLIGRRNRLSMIVSAPLNKSGVSRFTDTADALKNLTSVKLGWQLTNAPFVLRPTNTLNDFAVGVSAGQDQRTYYTADPTDPNKAVKNDHGFVTTAINARWTFLALPIKDYQTLLTFGQTGQRFWKNGDTQTRCPFNPTGTAGLVSCTTGTWGAPEKKYSRVFNFEWRQKFPMFDMGLKVDDDRTNHKTDVEVPFYLIRGIANSSDKTPLTAGIVMSRSTGDSGLKWGLFLSAPLSFSTPPR